MAQALNVFVCTNYTKKIKQYVYEHHKTDIVKYSSDILDIKTEQDFFPYEIINVNNNFYNVKVFKKLINLFNLIEINTDKYRFDEKQISSENVKLENLINFIFACLGKNNDSVISVEFAINHLTEIMTEKKYDQLWIPDVLIQNEELDSYLTTCLVIKLARKAQKRLRIISHLPASFVNHNKFLVLTEIHTDRSFVGDVMYKLLFDNELTNINSVVFTFSCFEEHFL